MSTPNTSVVGLGHHLVLCCLTLEITLIIHLTIMHMILIVQLGPRPIGYKVPQAMAFIAQGGVAWNSMTSTQLQPLFVSSLHTQ